MAFCGAVETLLDVEVPKRAQYLRVIHLELNRIMSHMVWLGTSARWTSARSRCSGTASASARRSSTSSSSPRASACTRATSRSAASSRTSRAGFEAKLPRVLQDACPTRPDEFRATARTRTRSSSSACATSARSTSETLLVARRHRPAAARRRQPVGPAQGGAVLELRGLRVQDPGRHAGRQLRPLRGAPRRDLRVRARSSSRRSTACPRARTSPTTARSCCRRATSSRPRWRRSSTTSSS